MRSFRWSTWYTFIFIILLTLSAVWIDIPGDRIDPFGWKQHVFIHQGLDLQGGLQVVLQAKPPKGQAVTSSTLEGTLTTIKRRVNGLGVSEPLVQTRGSNQIVIELPGVNNPENAVKVLQQTALLEIIDPNGVALAPGTVVTTSLGGPENLSASGTPGANGTPGATPGATPAAGAAAGATSNPTGPVYQTIITGADLKDAFPTTDSIGSLVVGFTLKSSAAQKFYQFTSTHLNQPMSIVIDKTVISSPTIKGAIQDTGQISGVPATQVNDLALQLKSGALSVPLEVVQSQVVGPTLGQDSINKSIVAGLAGLSIVGLFMILFYRLPGVLSVFALLIYT
ncbi:MAG TPA: protein translocase subunit SecD, partial [Nitrolancea sp.]|nr:protein translocase subunit SecD [Nitrolancea sp.]